MADEDRRGFSNTAPDADTPDEIKTADGEKVETKTSGTFATGSESTCEAVSQPEDMSEKPSASNEDEVKSDSAAVTPEKSEETLKRLLKAKEELNRARDELAQAQNDVQKAKQDLIVAEADPIQSSDLAPNEPESSAEKDACATEDVVETNKLETAAPTVIENTVTEVTETNKVPDVLSDETTPKLEEDESSPTAIDTEAATSKKDLCEEAPASTEKHEVKEETVVEPVETVEPSDKSSLIETETEESKEGDVEENENSCNQIENEVPSNQKDEVKINSEMEDDAETPDEIEGDLESGEEDHSDEEDEVVVEGEREEGDGEESGENEAPKPLDDDEDRRNPQYIPKRGGFYEHDDRTREEGGEEVAVEEPVPEEKPKKTARSEVTERWGHDMFDPDQQGPKSDHELVTLYGYDIRKEEGAPRARRRRRYGRGPNKYSRTWEDEDAYAKSHPRGSGGAPRGGGGGSASGSVSGGDGPKDNESPRGPAEAQHSGGSPPHRSGGDARGGGPPRGGGAPRGGGPSRGGRGGRFKESDKNGYPRQEDFPPLNVFKSERESAVEAAAGATSSSANWRDGAGRDNNNSSRGGGTAISFRRGGGGRTFEERNKAIKGRNEHAESLAQPNERQHQEGAPMDSMKDNRRNFRGSDHSNSPRGGPGGGSGRGFPRGRGGGGGNDRNWTDRESRGRDGDVRMGAASLGNNMNDGTSGGPHPTPGPHPEAVKSSNISTENRNRGGGHGRPSGRIPESSLDMTLAGMQRMRMDDNNPPAGPPHRGQDVNAVRSKRYSSQRQRMTTPPPQAGGVVMQPPYVGNVNSAYYAPYNDSPTPNYPPSSTYPDAAAPPLLPLVAAQGAPPFIAPPLGFPTPAASASFAASYQGYPPTAAAPPVQVGVPIGSPTQDMYGGGIMYYDTERQSNRHSSQQPMRRAKAAIPIVAPDTDVDNLLVSGHRYIHD